ncbi:hypothetical protein PTTG_28397 [Puccinia triticina 1-1 BBBD Race 1]|uniref:Ribokinase n=2 Tax=Puccinia triticina TaxID=208348 RepID=A0A180GBZ1_PUCT1|nr:uncharacterized protein PtA15_3A80 [Puccinia triticina]OAV90205.1 hypothetical protein PTTG_28397 [Puccinia triticina 1-1 BBBD Race 1]WAQ82716.1 hypothetical protein PtA15_3A80 [Puccinia triticina]
MEGRGACFIRSSVNIDQYLAVENIVRSGETISSREFTERIGGKGANAAVAISKAGEHVYFSGLMDNQSGWLKDTLNGFGVDVDGLKICDEKSKLPTGRAIIQVSHQTGENAIVLVPGANHAPPEFWPDLGPILKPTKYSYALLQNEIPIAQTLLTLKTAHSLGIATIFNPSPLPSLKEVAELIDWDCVDWLIVNEEEARMLRDRAASRNRCSAQLECGKIPDFEQELAVLQDLITLSMATLSIVITLGSRGSLLAFRNTSSVWIGFHTPASPGKRPVINTTGAGDCFTGFLVAELIRLKENPVSQNQFLEKLKRSMQVASQAARLCVENHGTIDSYPSLEEILSSQSFPVCLF